MTAAAFKATVHGFRTVPSRGVVSLTIEAPIEQHAEIARIAIHGAWVAVARLQDPDEKPAKEKENWREMLPSKQAAIRCNEPTFAAFLREQHREHVGEDIAQSVRDYCCVRSRKDLNSNHQARALWHQLDSQYLAWKAVEHA